jgi:hypothetical protein
VVKVELGPLPSGAVLAWVAYAQAILTELRVEGSSLPRVPPDVLQEFDRYLEQWQAVARAGEVFRWSGQAEAEEVEYLLHAWFNLAQFLSNHEGAGGPRSPAEGQLFYDAAVTALLDGLRAEGRESTTLFADHLGAFWPGRQPDG